jgi:hypothetical protein
MNRSDQATVQLKEPFLRAFSAARLSNQIPRPRGLSLGYNLSSASRLLSLVALASTLCTIPLCVLCDLL